MSSLLCSSGLNTELWGYLAVVCLRVNHSFLKTVLKLPCPFRFAAVLVGGTAQTVLQVPARGGLGQRWGLGPGSPGQARASVGARAAAPEGRRDSSAAWCLKET